MTTSKSKTILQSSLVHRIDPQFFTLPGPKTRYYTPPVSCLALILILALFSGFFGLPLFEGGVLAFLLTPILAHLIGLYIPLSFGIYALTILSIFFILHLLRFHRIELFSKFNFKNREDWITIGLWCASFYLLFRLCLLWPDFISMGERLRDYAILASSVKSPIVAQEPWLAGASMNYYLYWYRLGHCISTLLGLPVWDLYHTMVAFTFSLFFTSLFRLGYRHLSFSLNQSLLAATLVTFGSNVSGMRDFITQNNNWWGPSRVIQGAITEFPIWSFLLGDLHPHFLNLTLAPFLLCVTLPIFKATKTFAAQGVLFVVFTLGAGLWLYNSNAWELPAWAIFLSVLAALAIYSHFQNSKSSGNFTLRDVQYLPLLLGTVSFLMIAFSLLHSSRNILPTAQPLTLITGGATPAWIGSFAQAISIPTMDAPRTNISEILLHWGFPFGVMGLSFLALLSKRESMISFLAVLVAVWFSDSALWLLIVFLSLGCFFAFRDFNKKTRNRNTSLSIVAHALGISALLLLMFPEIVFFNDSYGGENERMNTIFKIYSASWFMLHYYAFSLARSVTKRISSSFVANKMPFYLGTLACLVLSLGFFYRTMYQRKSSIFTIQPYSQGLSALNQQYPGAGEAIQKLESLPEGVVLEAQGPPYSNTTHVATLAGKTSFLGWSNHVGLLTRRYDEISQREKLSDQIYQEPDCKTRQLALHQAEIRYLVVGPLELVHYPELAQRDFSCMRTSIASGSYKIFE